MKTTLIALMCLLAAATTASADHPALYPGDPGGTCVGGYNATAYSNACIVMPGYTNIIIPIGIGRAPQGTACIIGNTCVPVYGIEVVYSMPVVEPPAGLYVEVLCNQPNVPCGCTAPYAVELCAPVILPN